MKPFSLFIILLFLFSFTSCTLGFLDNDRDDGGEPSEAHGVYDPATRIYSYYSDAEENELVWYIQYDFDDQGRAVFYQQYLGNDLFDHGAFYVWTGDDVTAAAEIDEAGQPVSSKIFSYDGQGRLIQTDNYTGSTLNNSDRYSYWGSSSSVEYYSRVDTTETASQGLSFQYDNSSRIVRRTSFKDLNQSGCSLDSQLSLNVQEAEYTPFMVEPYTITLDQLAQSTADDYNSDGSGGTLIEDADIVIDGVTISTSITDGLNSDLSPVWDSYWYYEDFMGTGYVGITFNGDAVPLPEVDGEILYGLPNSGDIHMPVRFYLSTTEYLDGPIQVDLTYEPGTYTVTSKTTSYNGSEVLTLDLGYNSSDLLESLSASGDILLANFTVDLDYHSSDNPLALNLLAGGTDGILLQKFVYSYDIDGDNTADSDLTGLADIDTALELLGALHRITWYDGDYEEGASDNSAALVGTFDFQFNATTRILTINNQDGDGQSLGSYELSYDENGLRTSFQSLDANGAVLFEYHYGYDETMYAVDGVASTLNDWVDDSYLDINQIRLDEQGHFQIPAYLESFDSSDPVELLLNEVEPFLP